MGKVTRIHQVWKRSPEGGCYRQHVFQVILEYMLLAHILVTNISTCLFPILEGFLITHFVFFPDTDPCSQLPYLVQ